MRTPSIVVVPIILTALATLAVTTAEAQRSSGQNNVRDRLAASRQVLDPYWDGFIAMAKGNCDEAISELAGYAIKGRGFEDAQTALGTCLMMRAGYDPSKAQNRHNRSLADNKEFKTGRDIILRAADAGFHEAQAEIVRLYLENLAPNQDWAEGAKWAHLYLTNPTRLSIGLENNISGSIDQLKNSMTDAEWLEGKERARYWYPIFDFSFPPEPDTPKLQRKRNP